MTSAADLPEQELLYAIVCCSCTMPQLLPHAAHSGSMLTCPAGCLHPSLTQVLSAAGQHYDCLAGKTDASRPLSISSGVLMQNTMRNKAKAALDQL